MARRTLAVPVLIALAGFVTPAAAQLWTGGSAIGIEVRDRKKQPIEGAQVLLRYAEMEPIAGPPAATTGADGKVEVQGLAVGRWRVDVSKDGFSSYLLVLAVEPDGFSRIVSGPVRDATGDRMRIDVFRARPPAPPEPAPRPSRPAPPSAAEPSRPAPARPEPTRPDARPEPTRPEPVPPREAPPAAETAPPPQPVPTPPPAAAPEPAEEPAAAPIAPSEEPGPEPEPEEMPEPAPAEPEPAIEPEPTEPAEAPAAAPIAPSEEPGPEPEPEEMPEPERPPVPEPVPVPEPAPAEPEPMAEPEPAPIEPEPMPEPMPAQAPEPAPPAAEPEPTPEPEPMPEPAQPEAAPAPSRPAPAPSAPRPVPPAAAPPAAAPSAAPPPLPWITAEMRSTADGTCEECEPGTAVLAIEQLVGSTGSAPAVGCAPDLAARLDRIAALLAGAGVTEPAPLISRQGGALQRLQGTEHDTEAAALVTPFLRRDSACQALVAVLPAGTEYTGYAYEAADAFDSGPCAAGEECAIGTASFTGQPTVVNTEGPTLIYGVFDNRSQGRERQARMIVYFRP